MGFINKLKIMDNLTAALGNVPGMPNFSINGAKVTDIVFFGIHRGSYSK